MQKWIKVWIGILAFLWAGLCLAERRHAIEISGALANPQIKTLTVESLMKDFPELAAIETNWRNEGKHQFKGVRLKDLVQKYAAPGVTKAKVTATNAYSQVLSVKDWDDWGALVAFQEDGQVIATKNKGTFRIVYPYQQYDKNMSVKSMLENNSVWQIVHIEFSK